MENLVGENIVGVIEGLPYANDAEVKYIGEYMCKEKNITKTRTKEKARYTGEITNGVPDGRGRLTESFFEKKASLNFGSSYRPYKIVYTGLFGGGKFTQGEKVSQCNEETNNIIDENLLPDPEKVNYISQTVVEKGNFESGVLVAGTEEFYVQGKNQQRNYVEERGKDDIWKINISSGQDYLQQITEQGEEQKQETEKVIAENRDKGGQNLILKFVRQEDNKKKISNEVKNYKHNACCTLI